MLTLQRFTTTAVFVALVVLFIGAVVTLVGANRDSDYGYAGENEDVYWDAFVANVEYDEAQDTTNSDHGFYVENGSTKDVKVEYEFTHRFMKGSAVLIQKKRTGTKTAYRKNHPNKHKPRSANDTEFYRVDVSAHEGTGFKIDAYTRLRLLHGSAGKNILDRTFRIVVEDIALL